MKLKLSGKWHISADVGNIQNPFFSAPKFSSLYCTDEERHKRGFGNLSQNMFHVNQDNKVVKYGILLTRSRSLVRLSKLKL